MKYRSARPSPLKYPRAFLLLFALVIALVAVPIYSVRARLIGLGGNSSVSTSKDRARSFDSRISSLASLTRVQPSMVSESIATYSADCTTPQTTFFLGQTVCAITNDVDAAALTATPGRWVDWILTGTTNTIVSGSRTTTRITTNPQTFTYTPTQNGVYKVEITEDDGNGGDNPQTPAVFTVVNPPPIATYDSTCSAARDSFVLGEQVCIKVTGARVGSYTLQRVAVGDPANSSRANFDISSSSQTFSYTLPTASMTDGTDNRGRWRVGSVDAIDRDLGEATFIQVHDPQQQVADVQVSKTDVSGNTTQAGSN